MALDDRQLAALQAHLNRIGWQNVCTVCGHQDWVADGPISFVVPAPAAVPGSPLLPLTAPYVQRLQAAMAAKQTTTFPTVLLVCTTCGHTILLNARIARIVSQ